METMAEIFSTSEVTEAPSLASASKSHSYFIPSLVNLLQVDVRKQVTTTL